MEVGEVIMLTFPRHLLVDQGTVTKQVVNVRQNILEFNAWKFFKTAYQIKKTLQIFLLAVT